MALDVKPGDEILCPSYTFFATAGAIARTGAIPVFVDIEPATYNMDPAALKAVANKCKRLKAIIPVHLFGQCANMAAIEPIARELNVPIIEDAAQAIGSEDSRGKRAGSMGVLSCFSFFPSKNLGGFGDGGMNTSLDAELAEKMRVLRVHGSKPKYYHKVIGFNSRLDALQAAILRVKLRHLDSWTQGRQKNASFYDQAFAAKGAKNSSTPLSEGGLPLRTPAPAAKGARHIYNQYVLRVPAAKRDPLMNFLKEQNIGTEIYYPLPLHQQECFAYLKCKEGSLPHSEAAARETLAIPVYPELSKQQLEYVVEKVVEFLSK
jgi:dTDP-4-amino-4,6-dideoxygalactose transaminase